MKKIVNGLLYNTDKANQICSLFTNGGVEETLFRTKKENWFVYSVKHSSDDWGNSQISEQDIVPLSNDGALGWLRGHDFIDTLIEYFPEEVEEA